MRVLPYAPRFRKLGATANGAYHNTLNNGYANAPQSQSYTIPVDLIYDEGVPITDVQYYSNPVDLKRVVLAQLVKTAGMAINIITYAKQIEAFFRNGDNFDKAKTHDKGSIAAGDITADEIAAAVFGYDATKTGADPIRGLCKVAVSISAMTKTSFFRFHLSLINRPSLPSLLPISVQHRIFIKKYAPLLLRKRERVVSADMRFERIACTSGVRTHRENERFSLVAELLILLLGKSHIAFQFSP